MNVTPSLDNSWISWVSFIVINLGVIVQCNLPHCLSQLKIYIQYILSQGGNIKNGWKVRSVWKLCLAEDNSNVFTLKKTHYLMSHFPEGAMATPLRVLMWDARRAKDVRRSGMRWVVLLSYVSWPFSHFNHSHKCSCHRYAVPCVFYCFTVGYVRA